MGTAATLRLPAEDAACDKTLGIVRAVFTAIDAKMSTHKSGSDPSRLNRSAGQAAFVMLDPETFALIRRAQAFSARTGGLFDRRRAT